MNRYKRRPWGMQGWIYWILAFFAASFLASVPLVGTLLFVGVWVAAAIIWSQTPKTDLWSYAPVPPVGRTAFPLVVNQEVISDPEHARDLYRITATEGRDIMAALIWEPGNPESRNRVVVRVDLLAEAGPVTCGYLPDYAARMMVPMIQVDADRGLQSVVRAHIFGGDGYQPTFGVWLERLSQTV
ncbi:hypothetical protein [Actinomyces minihominis]|uniref:hypothetical protein n=1 Tax=Actinomyces minihominis TaxID=2002838 RepID=UPI00101AE871|nr:hypothetical protein [Actinomyces minihominis]